jgi:hypothetical protein
MLYTQISSQPSTFLQGFSDLDEAVWEGDGPNNPGYQWLEGGIRHHRLEAPFLGGDFATAAESELGYCETYRNPYGSVQVNQSENLQLISQSPPPDRHSTTITGHVSSMSLGLICTQDFMTTLTRRVPSLLPRNVAKDPRNLCSRTSISGTALSDRKPISGRFPMRSDSFHRQNVQRSAGVSCKRKLHACFFPPAYRSSTVHSNIQDYLPCIHPLSLGLVAKNA